MRKHFFNILLQRMCRDERIWFVTADLGYGLADEIRNEFPDRFINAGAAEQCMMGVCVGLAMSGKIPIAYSITPFLLWRTAETIRNYVNHESVPVKMVGSGRGSDYEHDGFSHYAGDDKKFLLTNFENILCRWPEDDDEIAMMMEEMFTIDKPFYLNLKR